MDALNMARDVASLTPAERQAKRDAAERAAQKANIDRQNEMSQYEWETYRQPEAAKYGEELQRQAQTMLDRSIAEAQARSGYIASAGSGAGGIYEANQLALNNKKQELLANIANVGKNYEQQLYDAWMNMKDKTRFQEYMQGVQFNQQMQLLERQAQLNDPSWWQSIGSIAGASMGFLTGGV